MSFFYTNTPNTNWVLQQLNSLLTLIPRVSADSTVPQDCSHFRHQPQTVCPGYPHFCPAAYKSGCSHNAFLRFDNPLKCLTALKKVLYLLLQLIRDTNEQMSKNIVRNLEGSQAQKPLSPGNQSSRPSWHMGVFNSESSLNLVVQEFL